jgi:hypothetical protein
MIRHLCFSLCVLGVSAISLRAASPELNIILPRGGQRGTEVVLNLQGARLADAKELVLYQPGLQVEKLEVVNPGHVKATVKIAADCPLGEQSLRIRCASGTSTLRTFWVGALPCVDEVEPNNEFVKPQAIAMNCTVHGLITPEDVDYFVVDAKKGQRLAVEIEGMRLGTAFFDPAIAILNEKRFELATSDDTPLLGQDACCSIIVPDDGKYVIRVRESAYGGSPASYYRLHVGTFPRPMAVFPPGGKVGEETEFTYLGDPSGEIRKKIKLGEPAADGKVRIHCDDAGGISPSPMLVRVSALTNFNEVEPNDTPQQATPGQAPCAFNGIINKPGDHDYFKFAAKKGEVFDIRCHARKLGSPLDAVMWVSYPDGRMIAANDDAEGSPDSFLRFTAPEDKEYVIGIRDHLYKGGPLFVYRIEVTPVEPRLSVGVITYGIPMTQERQTIDVPQGNRYAALVAVARADIGGDDDIGVVGLPDKVTAKADPMPAGLTVIPMVFEAAADAPMAGTLGSLTVAPVAKNIKVPTRFAQTIDLVFGQNNVTYATTRVDRLAMTVTEPVPYSIRIVEPKAPLVRNGIMQMKVVAERRDGHKAAINLQPLFNPPGVAANTVTIPEGQNEAVMTLTANGGAAVGKWHYVVMAQSTAKDGPVWVSSQLAPLEVGVQPVTFAFEKVAAEQGKVISLRGKVALGGPFEGAAKVKMFGLPNKVTAADIEVDAKATELSIPLTLAADSPPGQHRNLICQVTLMHSGEPVVYTAGVGELRIDKPPPPKANQPAAPPPPAAKPPAAKTEKPLSRLEQLRKDQQEKEKGGNR